MFAKMFSFVVSSNVSRFEPHPGFYRLHMKRVFDATVLWTFDLFYFELVTHVNIRNFTVDALEHAETM
jgi:hypothetical protein